MREIDGESLLPDTMLRGHDSCLKMRAMRGIERKLRAAAFIALFFTTIGAVTQQSRVAGSLDHVTRSAAFTFMQRNGKCVTGNISQADAATITVQQLDKSSIAIQRDALYQVIQGNALLFSARSSWADVVGVHLYPNETLLVTMRGGKQVRGKPVMVSADAIILKHGLSKTRYPKMEIATIDYLRAKPPTDSFQATLQEAPYALFFYPEFYHRMAGLAGRIPVRLFDAAKPEDNAPLSCLEP
jgi:hypothetical protein